MKATPTDEWLIAHKIVDDEGGQSAETVSCVGEFARIQAYYYDFNNAGEYSEFLLNLVSYMQNINGVSSVTILVSDNAVVLEDGRVRYWIGAALKRPIRYMTNKG